MTVVSTQLNVVTSTAILAIIASGFAVFGLPNAINLAHGQFVTIGSRSVAAAQVLAVHSGWLPRSLPFVGGLVGLLLERVLIRFLCQRDQPRSSLLADPTLSVTCARSDR